MTGSAAISFGRLDPAPGLLAQLITVEFAPTVVGEAPFLFRDIHDKLWRLTDYHGTLGLALWGIAGIDIVLWDLVGRAVG